MHGGWRRRTGVLVGHRFRSPGVRIAHNTGFWRSNTESESHKNSLKADLFGGTSKVKVLAVLPDIARTKTQIAIGEWLHLRPLGRETDYKSTEVRESPWGSVNPQ
jgi:hypothetical protein